MASYPGAVPSFTTKLDQVDVNFAAHVNRLQDEVRAIARELGVNPKGSFDSVRDRLQDLASSKAPVVHNHDERYWQRTTVTSKGQVLVGNSPGNITAVMQPPNNRVLLSDDSTASGVRWSQLTHDILTDNAEDNFPQYALADGTRGEFLRLSGGVLAGRVVLDSHAEKSVHLGNLNGAASLSPDQGSAFHGVLVAHSTVTLSAGSGDAAESMTLVLQQGGAGNYETNWSSNVRWMGSGPPAPTPVGSFLLGSFLTVDGANWLGVALNEF